MIDLDKSDFLYKHLTKLGVDNLEETYQEYAKNGVSNLKDFKSYLYSKFGATIDNEIEEETLQEVLPYFQDLKKVKKISNKDLKKYLVDYKQTKNKDIFELIVNSKLKDLLFTACLYHLKYNKVEINDIVQVCSLALIKAIEKYDEGSKLSLDDYIDFWVNREIENTFTKENK